MFIIVFINPRSACAARVTVVGLCVCVSTLNLLPHTLKITKERCQQIHRNTGIILNFDDFPKNASFKSYGIICSSRAALAS